MINEQTHQPRGKGTLTDSDISFHLLEWLTLNGSVIANIVEGEEQQERYAWLKGIENYTTVLENSLRVSYKIKYMPAPLLSSSTPSYLPKRMGMEINIWKFINQWKYLSNDGFKKIHENFMQNSSNFEITHREQLKRPSAKRRTPYNELSPSSDEEWTSGSWKNKAETQDNSAQSKKQTWRTAP